MNKKNIYIMIALHKKFAFNYKSKNYYPVQLGKALSTQDLGIIGDDTGDNISYKNAHYCELTAIYWAWKNVDADYYGLMHYRRYLISKDNIKWKIKKFLYFIGREFKLNIIIGLLKMPTLFQIGTANLEFAKKMIENTDRELNRLLNNYDVLLPKKENLMMNAYQQYEAVHFIHHLKEAISITKYLYPNIYPFVVKSMKQKYSYCTNMFVMRVDIFKEYSKFIFDVLFALEKRIVIPTNKYQKRVFGFISERLMAPYVEYAKSYHKVRVKELNILFISEQLNEKI